MSSFRTWCWLCYCYFLMALLKCAVQVLLALVCVRRGRGSSSPTSVSAAFRKRELECDLPGLVSLLSLLQRTKYICRNEKKSHKLKPSHRWNKAGGEHGGIQCWVISAGHPAESSMFFVFLYHTLLSCLLVLPLSLCPIFAFLCPPVLCPPCCKLYELWKVKVFAGAGFCLNSYF